MIICVNIGGIEHCFQIPVISWPWRPHRGGGPVNYPALFQDASIVASIEAATEHIADKNVRTAILDGVRASVEAMEEHASYARISGIAGRE